MMSAGSLAGMVAALIWSMVLGAAFLPKQVVAESAPLVGDDAFTDGLPQAANLPLEISWVENFARSTAHYTEELTLYELNGLVAKESLDSMTRGTDVAINQFVTFDMFGGAEIQEETFYQVQFYLQGLRINFGTLRSFDRLWSQQGGLFERYHIVSLTIENATIATAAIRWNDLRTMDASEFDGYYQDAVLSQWAAAFSQLQALLSELSSKSGELCALSSDDERFARIDDLWKDMILKIEADSAATILQEKVWETMLSDFFHRYKKLSFDGYFFQPSYCADATLESKLASCSIVESRTTFMPSEGTVVDNTLTVIDHDMGVVQTMEEELTFARRYLDIDQSILQDPRTECTFHYIILASSFGTNSSALVEQACKHFGAGAQSLRPMFCCQPPDDRISFCVPSASTQFVWNYVIMLLLGPFVLSPPPNPQLSGHQTRALLLGLGGGIIHSALLGLYPDMDLTSVEISPEMVDFSFRYLHLDNQFCAVHRLQTDGLLGDYELEPLIAARRQAGIVRLRSRDQQCRSRLVVADAWKFLAQLQPGGEAYHYVVLDMFDATAIMWNASRYEGKSNIAIDSPEEKFLLVREALHDEFGVMAMHLHLDGQFPSYLAAVRTVFGRENTAVLDSGGYEAVIVATRAGFYRYSSHYDSVQRGPEAVKGATAQVCSVGSADEEGAGRGQCGEQRKLPHPCSEPETFGHRVAAYADAWKYPQKFKMMVSRSLNCTGYQ